MWPSIGDNTEKGMYDKLVIKAEGKANRHSDYLRSIKSLLTVPCMQKLNVTVSPPPSIVAANCVVSESRIPEGRVYLHSVVENFVSNLVIGRSVVSSGSKVLVGSRIKQNDLRGPIGIYASCCGKSAYNVIAILN
ncbi:hypothetical protein J6590_016179 [Homalodisca vitripennis]|nr:hypothetical protein J6590_016179 [Homalodisca vitripennis]